MTIQSTTYQTVFQCDGINRDYNITYPVLERDDLVVVLTDSDGNDIPLHLGADYIVLLEENYEDGCIIRTNNTYTTSELLTVTRSTDMLQGVNYIEGSKFPAKQNERALDKLTMMVQELDGKKADKGDLETDADNVNVDTSNFDNNLDSNDDTVQKCLDKIDDLVIDNSNPKWGDIEGTLSNQTDLQLELDARYEKTDHISTSTGTADAGKPIVLNSHGRVDGSMVDIEGWTYIGDFTPTAGDEYPDTSTVPNASFWTVTGTGTGYTFTGGDLAGSTVTDGDFMMWGVNGWSIRESTLDPSVYYKLDGSQPLTAPFAGGGQQAKNLAEGTDDDDAVTKSQLDTKENSLGNPSTNGFVLSSDTSGNREWIPNGGESLDEAYIMTIGWMCK